MRVSTLPLTTSFSVLVLSAAAVLAGPRLIIEESQFDFGLVPQNARVSHVYWLKSAGDDTLKIMKVIPGCGCTKAPLEKTHLAPGDSTRLEVIFNTGKYRNKVTKAPRISTNEGGDQQSVRFTATVTPAWDSTQPVTVAPAVLSIESPGGEAPPKYSFTIRNVSDREVQLKLVEWPNELVGVDLPEKVPAGQTATVDVVLNGQEPIETTEKSITFDVIGAETTRFTVPAKFKTRTLGSK